MAHMDLAAPNRISRDSGVILSIAGSAELAPGGVPPKRGAAVSEALILDALRDQAFDLIDSIPLSLPPQARPARRGEPAPRSIITLDVPLGPDEQAVILLEDEGEYRWICDGAELPQVRAKRGAKGAAKRQVRFSIEIAAAPSPPGVPGKRAGAKRNWLVNQLIGQVTAYVFRFVIHLVGDEAVAFMERDLQQGLVALTTPEPQQWQHLDEEAPLVRSLPVDRRARLLLFLHGTFSNTVGSFGALGVLPQGRRFLEGAIGSYDAVLGFDHPTLSVDPLLNARNLLARLRKANWPQPPEIEIIAFSRGGLVARSLIEQVLPASGWGATIGRVVFVGCTNGGTALAEPANWRRFVDHYTTLSLGATRLLSLVPGALGVSAIASGVIRSVGALVKGLASGAIGDKVVPGLAAMEPDGDFVIAINQHQEGEPRPEEAHYYAVTSDFHARGSLASGGTLELPPKFLMRVADWGADALYGEPNDLVVHVRSMTQIEPELGNFFKERLDYGSNGEVYHTNYFTRDTTVAMLGQWLGLTAAAPEGVKPATRVSRGGQGLFKSISIGGEEQGRVPIRSGGKALGGRPSESVEGRKRSAPPTRAKPPSAEERELPPIVRSPAAAPQAAKDNVATESPVEIHFRAEMDQQVVVNKTVSVDVTIARHALELAAGRAGDTASAVVEASKKLIVQIAARRNFRIDGERRVEIDIPAPDDEACVSFDVTGLVAGEQGELWVQVRQGPVPLVTLKLKPGIVAVAAGPVPRLPLEQTLAAIPAPEAPLDQLLIEESFVGNDVQYHYFLDLPSLALRKHFESQVLKGRDAYITRIMDGIGDAWAGSGKDALEAFEGDLKSIGAMMFDELFPREMQELLWEHRKAISSVQVFSMEPFIPCELVYLKEPGKVLRDDSQFLGEMGLVRWLYDGYPPVHLTLGRGRARYVIPTYSGVMALPSAAGEESLLKQLFDAKAVRANVLEVQKLLRKPGSFDLLHFGGHAQAAGADRADAQLILETSGQGSTENALLATTVAQTAQLDADGHRPIVVLNACESARMSRSFASMGGFASAFVSRGAGVFIGTHWSVGDAPARTFIETFYKAFTRSAADGTPVRLGQAVQEARQAARAKGDATWLSYVVYGHPRAVVRMAP